jgi:hypothetical protein
MSRKHEFREIHHRENYPKWQRKWICTRKCHIFLNETGAFGTEYLHPMPFSKNEFRENRYNDESRTSLKDVNEIFSSF